MGGGRGRWSGKRQREGVSEGCWPGCSLGTKLEVEGEGEGEGGRWKWGGRLGGREMAWGWEKGERWCG